MNIYSILQLCGGLAFFLFGMHVMSGSLEKLRRQSPKDT